LAEQRPLGVESAKSPAPTPLSPAQESSEQAPPWRARFSAAQWHGGEREELRKNCRRGRSPQLKWLFFNLVRVVVALRRHISPDAHIKTSIKCFEDRQMHGGEGIEVTLNFLVVTMEEMQKNLAVSFWSHLHIPVQAVIELGHVGIG
jgi:hypothetical protein